MNAVTCLNEAVYSEALTRGHQYEVLDQDRAKKQIKVTADNGRTRWFPEYCFDMLGGDVPTLVEVHVEESALGARNIAVETVVHLSDGARRWCVFVTPEILSSLTQVEFETGRLIMYGRHVIVVSAMTVELIEQALRYIESQNELSDCTLPAG